MDLLTELTGVGIHFWCACYLLFFPTGGKSAGGDDQNEPQSKQSFHFTNSSSLSFDDSGKTGYTPPRYCRSVGRRERNLNSRRLASLQWPASRRHLLIAR